MIYDPVTETGQCSPGLYITYPYSIYYGSNKEYSYVGYSITYEHDRYLYLKTAPTLAITFYQLPRQRRAF